jgi:PTH2 family peptidyl-tRNA hydrolase
MEPKQVIVIRKDLNMRKGKMCAQAAHASMKVILDQFHVEFLNDIAAIYRKTYRTKDPMYLWLSGRFTKVVVGCQSKEELYDLAEFAAVNRLPYAIIEDSGLTEFHGEKTITALAIGPDDPEKIDRVTGHLKLL